MLPIENSVDHLEDVKSDTLYNAPKRKHSSDSGNKPGFVSER